MTMPYREYIKDLSLYDLDNLTDIIDSKKRQLQEQEKKTVWRVFNQKMCEGNFREEDYLFAVDLVAKTSANLWQSMARSPYDLNISIVGEKVPADEYESWFE